MSIPTGHASRDPAWGEALSFPRRLVEAVAAAGIFSALYYGVGEYVAPAAAPMATRIDAAIPYLPWSVWVYLPGYIGSFFIVLWVMRPALAFRAALRAYLALALLSLPFFLFYNVAGPRPPAPADPSIEAAMIRWLYATDPIGNTFPSLHVANATLSALLSWRMDRRVGVFVTILAAGVAVSVLTLKQHFLVDIPAGMIVGYIGYAAWEQQLAAVSARWRAARTWLRAPVRPGREGTGSRSSVPRDR